MTHNILSRLATETKHILDLIADIKRGEIKIPQFQRKFVWTEKQALDLLDSIVNNYPVGSVLLWRTKEKLPAERNIGNFTLPQTDDLSPTDYVLDGQQRLTVIYSCLGALEKDPGFIAGYDLAEQRFVAWKPQPSQNIFPMRWLFDTTKLLNFRTGLQTLLDGDDYQKQLDAVLHAFSNYKIPVVTLKDLTVEEVCPIFERINSSGTKLSVFDLMVAATWSKTFHLSEKVEVIATSLEPKGFGDIDPNTVLKCLSAVHYGSIKKDTLLSLRNVSEVDMTLLVETTSNALLHTVDLLSTEFKIYSWDFLPYEALAIILCYIFAKVPVLTPEKVKRVRQWFWRASFSERYRVGGELFISNDLEIIRDFIINEKGNAANFGSVPGSSEWLRVSFRSNNSRSRAFVLALALKNPRNLTNGSSIDTAEALSIFNKKQFHHIYPKAYLKRTGAVEDENLLLNICMLVASENNRVSDADPNVYLPECINTLNSQTPSVFASNLMPNPSVFDYKVETYKEFLQARLADVEEYVTHLCDGDVH